MIAAREVEAELRLFLLLNSRPFLTARVKSPIHSLEIALYFTCGQWTSGSYNVNLPPDIRQSVVDLAFVLPQVSCTSDFHPSCYRGCQCRCH
jgi:hypothetical protein